MGLNRITLCGWLSVEVDRGWPPTWELYHCGQCEAPRWTLERRPRGGDWVLCRQSATGAHDCRQMVSGFHDMALARLWIERHGQRCTCEVSR